MYHATPFVCNLIYRCPFLYSIVVVAASPVDTVPVAAHTIVLDYTVAAVVAHSVDNNIVAHQLERAVAAARVGSPADIDCIAENSGLDRLAAAPVAAKVDSMDRVVGSLTVVALDSSY